MGRAAIRYSEAFKRQVVEEIERGKFSSPHKAKLAYRIKGKDTVERWIRKYGREELLPKVIRIETLKERDKLKEARQRIKDLETALVDAHIDYSLERTFLEVACERLGVKVEDFKKKNELTLSDVRRRRNRL